jgi:glycosyltransferase involved in cell wall biosynthesis
METRIALCITVHNRPEIAKHSIEQWQKLAPANCDIFIVDDASNPPYPDADYRFENNVGISTAKNMCLQLAENADHIFLADEDVYALDAHWATWYTHSNLQHACYIFNRKLLWKEPDYKAYDLPRGCLLYFTKHCIEKAGGFDTNFKNCYEHAELSRRIFNMNMTPAPYIDIPHSKGLFYSHDEENTAQSSFDPYERSKAIRANKKYWEETKLSNQFIPYK